MSVLGAQLKPTQLQNAKNQRYSDSFAITATILLCLYQAVESPLLLSQVDQRDQLWILEMPTVDL